MNEVIAGLAGGFIAILGGLSIQVVVGRQASTRRRHELIAAFLAVQRSIARQGIPGRADEGRPVTEARMQKISELHERTATLGHELALMCGRETDEAIQDGIQRALNLWWASDPEEIEDSERYDVIEELEESTEYLTERLHSKYRRRQIWNLSDRGSFGAH